MDAQSKSWSFSDRRLAQKFKNNNKADASVAHEFSPTPAEAGSGDKGLLAFC